MKKKESENEKRIRKIAEERTYLIAELLSKQKKGRRIQIERQIEELDNEYRGLHE